MLKRAGLILAVTAWETYVEDRVLEALDQKLEKISGSSISEIIHKKFEKELKKFHNPNAQKTKELFSDYIGCDPTSKWKCWATTAATKKQLDKWVTKRGAAAHRSKGPSGLPFGTGKSDKVLQEARRGDGKSIKVLAPSLLGSFDQVYEQVMPAKPSEFLCSVLVISVVNIFCGW